MQITSLKEANKVLAAYVPAAKEFTGKNITLKRVAPLLEALGNPHKKLRIIHVAGTSGKTSTSYYLSAILQACGQKTGLTVSPHVDKVTERIQINGQPLSDETFCKYLSECLDIVDGITPQPSYFELLVALAFWVFEREKVGYAVVETGMGGLHDASNVAGQPDKVCVITDIGYDHMQILGHTIAEIAAHKAGIIHAGNEVYSYRQSDEIMAVIDGQCQAVGAHLNVINELEKVSLEQSQLPAFQLRNWQLAHAVIEAVATRDGLPQLAAAGLATSLQTYVPGRMDATQVDGKTIIMDGAHNDQKMSAFVDSFKKRYPGQKVVILLALKNDKAYSGVIDQLMPIAESFILTSFTASQDLPVHAIDPQVLADELSKKNFPAFEIINDTHRAYQALLKKTAKLGIVTGSFYLLSQLRGSHL